MRENGTAIQADVVGQVLTRLKVLQSYGANAAKITSPGVAIILSGMRNEGCDRDTIDYLSRRLLEETSSTTELSGIIGKFQAIYDRLRL